MLPVLEIQDQIIERLRAANRLVLTAPTGSGKTTQVPQIVFRSGIVPEDQQIIVLQPRRLATRMVAARVALEMQTNLGRVVGYQTRHDSAVSNATRIRFLDRNVFDGFLYHYAVTTYDQGFRRSTNGQTYFTKFDSPLELGTANPNGGEPIPGPTQLRYEFRRPPPEEFQPVTAVPNPFRDSASDGSLESSVVFFTSAPPRGTLYIFTLSGDLVLERSHELPTIGTITWDTRNGGGEKVASGVYIYKIVDLVSGQQSYGRLAVIR